MYHSEEACAEGSAATGAAQLWHQALAQLLRKVHSDPVEMADALLTACGQLVDSATAVDAAGDDSTSTWLQALAAAALLLDLLPDARPAQRALAGFRLLDVLQAVVLPALAHEAVLVGGNTAASASCEKSQQWHVMAERPRLQQSTWSPDCATCEIVLKY